MKHFNIKTLEKFVFVLIAIAVTGAIFIPAMAGPSYAELEKEKRVTLSGVNLTTAVGNTTGAVTGANVAEAYGYPDEFTCYSFVTDAAGATDTGTATWTLEGSYDNSFWAILQTTSITASEEDLIYNATVGSAKYYRVNVGAIETANSTYVNVQCIFK